VRARVGRVERAGLVAGHVALQRLCCGPHEL
jgi:hypothetical protein